MRVSSLIDKMRSDWGKPSTAVHRGRKISFKLICTFHLGAQEGDLVALSFILPSDFKEFLLNSNGASLFADEVYGQWGLRVFGVKEIENETEKFLVERSRDAKNGDAIIGEFIGDSDLLLLRCDPSSSDFGTTMIASAIDPRSEWELVSPSFETFLDEYINTHGDKYWEVQQK